MANGRDDARKESTGPSSDDLLKAAWSDLGRREGTDSIAAPPMEISDERRRGLSEIASTADSVETDMLVPPPRRQAPSGAPPPPPAAPRRPRRAQPIPRPRRVGQPRQERPEGGGSARRIIGAVLSIGLVVFVFAIGSIAAILEGGSDSPDVSVEVTVTATTLSADPGVTQRNIRDIEPGSCIASLPDVGEVIDMVPIVSCSAMHDYELFANVEVSGPETYPGFDSVLDLAFDQCGDLFSSYVGEEYAVSDWYIDVITPTEAGWNRLSDRAVNCLVYIWDDEAGVVVPVTGSAEGSGGSA